MNKLKVLVACEFSGTVRDAFIKLGHDAMSCDFLPTESPGPHYQGDIKNIIKYKWNLVIAHPPCTYLTNSGVRWLYNKDKSINMDRWVKMREAALFFRSFFTEYNGPLCVENPIMHSHALNYIGLEDCKKQIIQPWMFGHPESKATVLWLRGLPEIIPTNILEKPKSGRWNNQTPSGQNKLGPSPDRWKERSKTYYGIATALAEQFSNYLLKNKI